MQSYTMQQTEVSQHDARSHTLCLKTQNKAENQCGQDTSTSGRLLVLVFFCMYCIRINTNLKLTITYLNFVVSRTICARLGRLNVPVNPE